MAGRPGLDPLEEKKSYSALFVVTVALLLAGAIWAIWDDNISRRPWKQYGVEFDRLAYDKYMQQADGEQAKLNKDPAYVKATKDLETAQRQLASGETSAKLADLHGQLVRAQHQADDKDQVVRFTKSELTELWYDYNHAIQEKLDSAPFKARIDELDNRLKGEQGALDAAKKHQADIQGQIDAINSKVDSLNEQLKTMGKARDDLIEKADTWMIPVKFKGRVLFRYPKIPKIEQTSIDDFDRNAFDEAVARVDRCQSCHIGIDKKGFEDAPQPFRTHSNFEQIILKHPPDKLGCTPCHEGQGAAVSSVAMCER